MAGVRLRNPRATALRRLPAYRRRPNRAGRSACPLGRCAGRQGLAATAAGGTAAGRAPPLAAAASLPTTLRVLAAGPPNRPAPTGADALVGGPPGLGAPGGAFASADTTTAGVQSSCVPS